MLIECLKIHQKKSEIPQIQFLEWSKVHFWNCPLFYLGLKELIYWNRAIRPAGSYSRADISKSGIISTHLQTNLPLVPNCLSAVAINIEKHVPRTQMIPLYSSKT